MFDVDCWLYTAEQWQYVDVRLPAPSFCVNIYHIDYWEPWQLQHKELLILVGLGSLVSLLSVGLINVESLDPDWDYSSPGVSSCTTPSQPQDSSDG